MVSLKKFLSIIITPVFIAMITLVGVNTAFCGDLEDVLKTGKLRHLGIIYANFVMPNNRGLDVELMQMFAEHLGVKYEFVETTWDNILPDLTGKKVVPKGDDIQIVGEAPVRGDIIATGFTELNWRKKIVNFSDMTFPTGIWLITRADSKLQPIVPSNDVAKDINLVKSNLNNVSVLGLKDSCLDPSLYKLEQTGANLQLFPANQDLDEMIPAMMARRADTTIMDVPVALVAMEKWPGKIKIIGPISESQNMACAFPKTSPKLLQAFNDFFKKIKEDGTYKRMVEKYYPSLFVYYPEAF